MTEHESKKNDTTKKQLFNSLKVGLSVGTVAIGLPALIFLILYEMFWSPAVGYNRDLFLIPFCQFIVIGIIGSYIVARSLCNNTGLIIRSGKDAWFAGIFTALAEGFWILLFGAIRLWSDPIYNEFPRIFNGFTPFLYWFLIIIIIQGLVTRVIFRRSVVSKIPAGSAPHTGHRVLYSRYPYLILCIVIVLVLVLPAGITFGAMRMDLIGPVRHINFPSDFRSGMALPESYNFINVERSGVDTIVLSLWNPNPDMQTNFGHTNPFMNPEERTKPHFIIQYNSKDVSDQATIDRQGLSVTIDPPQGLEYGDGARVVLRGPEISNATSKGHLKIIDVNPSRGSKDIRETVTDEFV